MSGYTTQEQNYNPPIPAVFMMSNDKTEANSGIGKDWGLSLSNRKRLFKDPKDFDIYCDREAGQNYIFHTGELNCTIDHLEYDPENQRITVHTNDGQKLDLGVRIQWLVRPYIAKEQDIFIVRTENGQMVEGIEVRLKVKQPPKEDEKTLN